MTGNDILIIVFDRELLSLALGNARKSVVPGSSHVKGGLF